MRKTLSTIALALGLAGGLLVAPVGSAAAGAGNTPTCHQQYAGKHEVNGVVVVDQTATCYPDTGHCASYFEANKVRGDMRRKRVHRILGTAGIVVSKHAMDLYVGGFLDMLGLNQGDVSSAPLRQRLVKAYPTCAEDGVPAVFFVQYRMRGNVGRVTQTLWH